MTTPATIPPDQVAPAPVPARVGQATAIEQSRAVAEVQSAIIVAQQCPRSMTAARAAMRESCELLSFAEAAFFAYPKGNKTITGPSIFLAKELARCFGNVQYGVDELRRDDDFAQSEMQAWAWDVQMNTRSSIKFINPHKRDRTGGPVLLSDLRDIYENNANMGNRRLRQAIFSILPTWFREEAIAVCRATLKAGDGKPLEERVEAAIRTFDVMGVPQSRLEQMVGRPYGKWTVFDVTHLRTTHRSIERGELSIDEAFPQARVTADEIAQQAEQTEQPAPREYADDDPERPFD